MIGAARLDAHTYEEVEADRASMTGAVFTAVIASPLLLELAFGTSPVL
jgi:hypothetical protein